MKWVGHYAWTGLRWVWEGPPEHEGCYCVCHSGFRSCPACEHCLGDNEVGHYFKVVHETTAADD